MFSMHNVIILIAIGFCCFKLGELRAQIKVLDHIRDEIVKANFKPDWSFISRLIDFL